MNLYQTTADESVKCENIYEDKLEEKFLEDPVF